MKENSLLLMGDQGHTEESFFVKLALIAACIVLGILVGFSTPQLRLQLLGLVALFLVVLIPVETLLLLFIFSLQFHVSMIPVIDTIGSVSIRVNDILLALLLAKWLFEKKKAQDFTLVNSTLYVPIFLFLFVAFLSELKVYLFFDLQYSALTLVSLFKFIEYVVVCFVIADIVKTSRQIKKIVTFMLALATLQAAYAILQHFGIGILGSASFLTSYFGMPQSRASGFIGSIGSFGIYMVLFTIIQSNILQLASSPLGRFVKEMNVLLFLLALVLTLSRGSWLALVISVLVWVVWRYKDIPRIWFFFIPLILAFFSKTVIDRILNVVIQLSTMTQASLTHRFALWYAAFPLIKDNLLLGVGWSGYKFIAPQYASFAKEKISLTTATIGGSAHNQYLQIASDMGIIGLIVFIWLLVSILRCSWQLYRDAKDSYIMRLGLAFSLSFIALYVFFLSSSALFAGDPITGYFWLFVGLVIATKKVMIKEGKQKEREPKGLGASEKNQCL